ncbi:MAG TPA: hypothetical protein DCE02_00385 [Ruminiclostridium sp.]|uniref:TerD domain-containing protein n=1 Tax=Acetivibrio saccincola TaxID=1677857 RepID=A0A2K9E538_9FIRM|nr:TerD family protein [Acetivibrio saccincola]HAA42450.1 hypothetical protein [Ruminiclostridium sp.]AUG57518.1 hypothetical protein HVS_08040 [Acetivibrio saccincola]NLW26016.1 TerD family protein [Acetivibrio saccincola]PQQ67433.1 hypothetical protein B9R14_12205 [Acetivibrio saccincola]HOA96531.1 TerD family protein [Acetivibrio saccincola]
MGIQVVSGQKVILTESLESASKFIFKMEIENRFKGTFDMDLFAVNIEKNAIANKENIVFYNNVKDIGKSILYSEVYDYEIFEKKIDLDIRLLPEATDKIVMAATLYRNLHHADKDKETGFTFSAVNKTTGLKIFTLKGSIPANGKETLVLGEVYRYKDTWRFNTVNNYSDENLLGVLNNIYNAKVY